MIQGSNQAKGSIITLVVLQELSTRSYIGCPKDSKKIPEAIEGKDAVCPKCGQIVKPKSLQWTLFLVGDTTDDIIASFPPSIMSRPSEGMIIVAQGLLGENEEFLVYRWTLPADAKPGATPEAPLQTFFKPVTATPTATPTATDGSIETSPTEIDTGIDKGTATTATPTTATPSTAPTTAPITATPTATPTATDGSIETSPTEIDTGIDKGTATTAQTQPPSTPVIEPDSGAVKSAEHAEQATLTSIPVDQHANDSLLSTSAMQSPMQSSIQPSSTPTSTATEGTQAGAKGELKAIEGASLPSVKYARIAGLLAKGLNEFKLQFEASFPKDDISKAIAAANCTVVDNKIAFTGG